MSLNPSNLFAASTGTSETIYKDFCDVMRNHSRDQIRSAGDIVKAIAKNSPHSSIISNIHHIESRLENIENNLNKVSILQHSPY